MEFAEFYPVHTPGLPTVYDIYIDGKWIGSRRTKEQCDEAVRASMRGNFKRND